MITTRDPETMTADERRCEAASILAAGLLRHVRMLKNTPTAAVPETASGSHIKLDLPSETRLSVAQEPVG